MQRATFTHTNARGHHLHCVEYAPPPGVRPRAALFLHHGIAEHIERYAPVFSHWASDHALCVYGYDCHGHGRSAPFAPHERVYVHRFDDLVDDFVDFVGHVTEARLPRVAAAGGGGAAGVAAAGAAASATAGAPPTSPSSSPPPSSSSSPPPPLPRVLGGHSLGGLVAAHAVLRLIDPGSPAATPESTGVAGLVLHSAALDVVWTPLLRAMAAAGSVLAMLLPRARIVPAVKPEDMHPDPRIVAEYLEDPHVVVGNTRARTANEVLRGFRGLAGKEEKFDLPILAVHGSSDATTSLEAVRRFCARAASAASGLVRLREVEGGFHELMAAPGEREREAEEVAAWVEGLPAVRAWMAAGQQQQQQTSRL